MAVKESKETPSDSTPHQYTAYRPTQLLANIQVNQILNKLKVLIFIATETVQKSA